MQAYINRARAYNGTCNQLVTEENVSSVPAELRRIQGGREGDGEPAAGRSAEDAADRVRPAGADGVRSDVQQQYGMTVGVPNAGQLRALGMLNIRGERSVTCKGEFDRHPSKGPLPAGAPQVCEEFRKQPDAAERAAELDAQYGRTPDLAAMPMYCIPFSFKDPYDTKDMRSTGGGDAHYDMDFPARDQTLVAQLRAKGAIIYAKANTTEYNGRARQPGRRELPDEGPAVDARATSAARGPAIPSNSYDTTRAASIGSSSGSGVSVGANLVMCSLCEETGQSCRGPANHNSVALILPHKSLISFHGGAIGASIYKDRAGIICRNVADSVRVLDALKDPVNGYYDPRDIFTTVPRSTVSKEPYAKSITAGTPGALKGMRIGIIREFMVKHATGRRADRRRRGQGDEGDARRASRRHARRIGAGRLDGRSRHREHDDVVRPGDCAADAGAVSAAALSSSTPAGKPKYRSFAAKIEPTEFAPG